MALEFDPVNHRLLGDRAKQLDPEILEAQAELAAEFLGLAGLNLRGRAHRRALLAVVLRINCVLERSSDGREIRSESKGGQSRSYGAAQTTPQRMDDPCLMAQQLAAQLVATGPAAASTNAEWLTVRSVRNDF
jgi:hypothetical protein